MNAVALAKRHPNLFLLCVSNFSCTIDAFTHSMLASELGAKPYLILEIDAHTADAGVQTRLEAFLDIVRNYRRGAAGQRPAVHPVPARRGRPGHPLERRVGAAHRSAGETLFPQLLAVPRARPSRLAVALAGPARRRTCSRWTGSSSNGACNTPRAASACRCRSASGSCSRSTRTARPARSRGSTCVQRRGALRRATAYLGYFERFIAEQRLPDLFLVSPDRGERLPRLRCAHPGHSI